MAWGLLRWLFSPHFFEIAAPLLAGLGLTIALAVTPEDIRRAHWFFGGAFALALGRAAWWLIGERSLSPKPLIAGLVFAGIGAGWMAVYQWVDGKLPKAGLLNGDQVSKIETLLADVQDPAYRNLVASIIHAFEPTADIAVGTLVTTPDGVRKVDIEVRSSREGHAVLTVVDVVDLPEGQRANITLVDAADSKRLDLKADAILICSNTGFDEDAISKAKRRKIGVISVLRRGDQRIKAVIEEAAILRKIRIHPLTFSYIGDDLPRRLDAYELKFRGKSVDAWLQLKAGLVAAMNPALVEAVTGTFNLKEPTYFETGNGTKVLLRTLSVTFQPKVQWLSQVVQLDATAGIYDYVRGRVRLAAGNQSYTVSGLNFDTAKPLPNPPPLEEMGIGLGPGEIDMALAMIEGGAPPAGAEIAPLDDLVKPEDLNLTVDVKKLKQASR